MTVGCDGIGVLVAVGVLVAGGTVGVSVAGGTTVGVSVAGGKVGVGVSTGLWKTDADGRRLAETGNTKMAANTNTVTTKIKREVIFIGT